MSVIESMNEVIVKNKFGYPKYSIVDYREEYGRIMQFNKNKKEPIHQWYPFVEGYSKEFIQGIVAELPYDVQTVLEPFAGSGTTPVELQRMGIRCHSFEVSPFMHLLATTKLEKNYNLLEAMAHVDSFREKLNGKFLPIAQIMDLPLAKTYQPRKGKSKWVFDRTVMRGILDIKHKILQVENLAYRNLFKIALASILLEVSNVYRNGKCLSYKKNWEGTKHTRRSIHELFLNKLDHVILPDLKNIDFHSDVDNKSICQNGDVRRLLDQIKDDSIDLVITSPPYLNTRDYTDIYMTELWILDLVESYEDLRALRADTLFSHVQIRRDSYKPLNIKRLRDVYKNISDFKDQFWNPGLLNMIEGYFGDMEVVIGTLSKKLKKGRRVYFNVANSAYYGQEILVDEIIAEIAENNGLEILEIREARRLSPSGQQKDSIDYLRESVIVMQKS